MIRTMLLASTLAFGLSGVALAQGGPRLVGGGEDAQVVYDAPSENVVGGGSAGVRATVGFGPGEGSGATSFAGMRTPAP